MEAKGICAVPEEEVIFGLLTTLGGFSPCPILFGRKAVYSRSALPAKGEYAPLRLTYEEFVSRPFGHYGFAEASSTKPTAGEIARMMVQEDVIQFMQFVQQELAGKKEAITERP